MDDLQKFQIFIFASGFLLFILGVIASDSYWDERKRRFDAADAWRRDKLERERQRTNPKTCTWETDDDEHYVTGCGWNWRTFRLRIFCFCGKRIRLSQGGTDDD